MREIEFRGKRIDNNEWVYGYYIVAGGMAFISSFGIRAPIAVIPDTVGQYTGLKDKNGTKIYEGDILGDGDLSTRIHWDYTEAGFTNGVCGWRELLPYLEVIGNVHDMEEKL